MRWVGAIPSLTDDLVTKGYADATYTGGGGGGADAYSQVFVQQLDPEVTNPGLTGPAIWYQTDGSGNIIDRKVRVAAPGYVAAPTNGFLRSPLCVPGDEAQPIPSMLAQSFRTLASGEMTMTLFTPAVDIEVNSILTVCDSSSNQSAATFSRVAIYRVDDINWPFSFTCVARSAHSAARWSGGGLKSAAIVDNGAASPTAISSLVLDQDQMYGVAVLSVGHTGNVRPMSMNSYRHSGLQPVLSFTNLGMSDLPPTISSAGYIEEYQHVWVGLKVI